MLDRVYTPEIVPDAGWETTIGFSHGRNSGNGLLVDGSAHSLSDRTLRARLSYSFSEALTPYLEFLGPGELPLAAEAQEPARR